MSGINPDTGQSTGYYERIGNQNSTCLDVITNRKIPCNNQREQESKIKHYSKLIYNQINTRFIPISLIVISSYFVYTKFIKK